MPRYQSLDLTKGLTILGVIFFHAGMQFFDEFENLNFEKPNLLLIFLAILAMWGGIFIMVSGITHGVMSAIRQEKKQKIFYPLFSYSLILIIVHFFYNYVVAPADSILVNSFDDKTLSFPSINRLFDNSSLLTIGLNLLIISFLIKLLLKLNFKKHLTIPLLIFITCCLTIGLNYARIKLETIPTATDYRNEFSNLFQKIPFALIYERPYPLFPYFGFTLFGIIISLALAKKQYQRNKYLFLITGFLFSLIGLINLTTNHPSNILLINTFWFNKTLFEFGFFILSINLFLIFFDLLNKKNKPILSSIQNMGFLSLTIYILQTPLAVLTYFLISKYIKIATFNLNKAAVFACFNMIVWYVIAQIWAHFHFKFSLEYFLDKLFILIKRKSCKFESYATNQKKKT